MDRTEKSHANVLAPMARTIFPPHGLLLAAHFTAIPSLWAGRFQRCHRAWGSNVTSCQLRPKFWAKSFQWCLIKHAKVGPSDTKWCNDAKSLCMAMHGVKMAEQHAASTKCSIGISEAHGIHGHRRPWSSWSDSGSDVYWVYSVATECTEAVSKNSASWEAWQLDIAWHSLT